MLLVDFKGHLQYTLGLTGSLKRLCFKTHHAGSKVLICRKAVGWLTKGDLLKSNLGRFLMNFLCKSSSHCVCRLLSLSQTAGMRVCLTILYERLQVPI